MRFEPCGWSGETSKLRRKWCELQAGSLLLPCPLLRRVSRTAEVLTCVGRLGWQLPKFRTWGSISIGRAMIHDDSIVLTPLTPAMIQVNAVDIFAGFTGFLRTVGSINNLAVYRGLRA